MWDWVAAIVCDEGAWLGDKRLTIAGDWMLGWLAISLQEAIIVRPILALALLTASVPAWAAGETQTVEQSYKNIQVLKGIPSSELSPIMNLIAGALGVNCAYCHTTNRPWPQGYEKDDIKAKQTAREMIRMTRQINEASFAGRTVVTCATCHAGHTHPATFMPADTPEAIKALIAQPARSETGPLPTVEELFAKYESAIGGEAAISKLTAVHRIGTIRVAPNVTVRTEQFATSRGLFLEKITAGPQTLSITGFDGTRAYTVSPAGVPTVALGADADRVKLSALFYRGIRMKGVYPQAHTLRKEKLGGKDVYVVSANLSMDRYTDILAFDADSGLLVRCTTLTGTPLGPYSQTWDFENYREVEGVKISMDQVRTVRGVPNQYHVEEIRLNEPLDEAKFAMPAAPAKER